MCGRSCLKLQRDKFRNAHTISIWILSWLVEACSQLLANRNRNRNINTLLYKNQSKSTMPFLLPALSSLVADILIIYLVYDNDNENGNGNGSSAQTAAPSSNEPHSK